MVMNPDEIIEFARRHHALDLTIGEIDCDCDDSKAMLLALASLRREHGYGINPTGRVLSPVSRLHATMLADAGVTRVELGFDALIPRACERSSSQSLLTRIQSVKLLHEVGIKIDWNLPGYSTYSREYGELVDNLSTLHHLPPPVGVICRQVVYMASVPLTSGLYANPVSPQNAEILQAVARWQEGHEPRVLTYAPGPGFVQIRDGRRGTDSTVFTVLSEPEATIFLAANEVCSLDDLAKKVSSVSATVLDSALAQLVKRRLLCSMSSTHYLALPIHRLFSEQWLSLEH